VIGPSGLIENEVVPFFHARRITIQCLAVPENDFTEDAVEPGPGDTFIGVDWCADIAPSLKRWFLERRRHRTGIVFIAHDLLRLRRSVFFPPEMRPCALDWINTVLAVADGAAVPAERGSSQID